MPTALRVLVIEDEALIAMLYTEVLAGLGHEDCAIARTENEAVDVARAFKPDLMIVDQHLSEGTGMMAVTRILAEGFVPHVLVSGSTSWSGVGPQPVCLQKPFNEAQLVRAIEAAMAPSRQPAATPQP